MSNKKKRKQTHTPVDGDTLISRVTDPRDDLCSIFKHYAGYQFVSVSKPNEDGYGCITIHKSLPALDKHGTWVSDAEYRYVQDIRIRDERFPGLLVRRDGSVCVGDPFSDTRTERIQQTFNALVTKEYARIDLSEADVQVL